MSITSNDTPTFSGMQLAGLNSTGSGPRWFLTGQTDAAGPVRRVMVNASPFVVGRMGSAALPLDTRSVSKCHAELLLDGDQLFLRDNRSTNGTYVNGKRITEATALQDGDLVQFASIIFRVGRESVSTVGYTSPENDLSDHALALMQFDRLIHDGGVFPHFQPIVGMSDQQVVAYEILGRSRLFGLSTPDKMFSAAQQLNQVRQLSEVFRNVGTDIAVRYSLNSNLFVNTHPDELGTPALSDSLRQLRQAYPSQALTLEIHEKAVTRDNAIEQIREMLRELDIRLAFDDFGEGQTRLVELSEVRPDYLKFDMSMTRAIHSASSDRQKVVATLVQMVNELGIISLAEGVECAADHQVLAEMGFKLGQGYFYGHPAPISRYLPGAQDPPEA